MWRAMFTERREGLVDDPGGLQVDGSYKGAEKTVQTDAGEAEVEGGLEKTQGARGEGGLQAEMNEDGQQNLVREVK